MKRLPWATRGCWLCILLGVQTAGQVKAGSVAIIHARAWTMMSPTPVENATIVATDGRIISVAAGAPPPSGARVVDALDRPVTPGMMHAATQLGLIEVSAASETNDTTVSGGGLGASFDVQYAVNPNSELIALARADGLTRAIVYPGGSGVQPWSGTGALLRLYEASNPLEQSSVGLFAVVGSFSIKAAGGSRAAQWKILRDGLEAAKTALQSPTNTSGRLAETRALEPLLAGKAPLVIACNRESDIRQAMQLAADYGIRVVINGGAEAWRVARELAAAKIAVIVDPQVNLPASFDMGAARADNAALLQAAGVTVAVVVVGNGIYLSYNAGSSLREGAGLAVANGLPYVEGLRAITQNPAKIWRVDDRYGTIVPGKDADLVIWDGDPLEPATQPVRVFVAGREVSRVTRQQRLRDRYLPKTTASVPR